MASALIAGLASCGPLAGQDVAPGREAGVQAGIQVGTNQSLPVAADGSNVPAALLPGLDAIGRMQGTACTGTHLGGGLVLTAAHCVVAESADSCASTAIEWGVRGGVTSGVVGRCEAVMFAELTDDRDIALFQVDLAPAAALPADVCRARGPGDPVFLLSHPERRPLEWSGPCMLEDADPPLGRDRIAHVCDTLSGSSGAPLLDADTLEVVAVHVGGAGAINQATLLSSTFDLFAPLGWTCECEAH